MSSFVWKMPNIFIVYKKEVVFSYKMMTTIQHKNQYDIPLFPVLLILISVGIIFFRLITPVL